MSTAEQTAASEAGRALARWRPQSHFPGKREDAGHMGHSDSPASVQTIMGIYPSFRAGWGSRESGSTSRGGDIHPDPDTLHAPQHSWSCHLSWLDPAQLPKHSAPGGAPLQHPGCSPSLPPCGSHPSLELAHPAEPHRGTWELNIPSAHHWCINYEPQREKAERGVDQRKILIGCSEGLAPQDESSAGWHLPSKPVPSPCWVSCRA